MRTGVTSYLRVYKAQKSYTVLCVAQGTAVLSTWRSNSYIQRRALGELRAKAILSTVNYVSSNPVRGIGLCQWRQSTMLFRKRNLNAEGARIRRHFARALRSGLLGKLHSSRITVADSCS